MHVHVERCCGVFMGALSRPPSPSGTTFSFERVAVYHPSHHDVDGQHCVYRDAPLVSSATSRA